MADKTKKICTEYQQKMYENLGNREYECYKSDEVQYLKLKIGYALFGIPDNHNLAGEFTAEQCYSEKKVQQMNEILKLINTHSTSTENHDLIVSFLFNCCAFIKKSKNDSADDNIGCYPLIRVKKCSGSPNNCCVYIDNNLRVYKNWKDYLQTNEIPKANMFVPLDGKYQGDANGEVLLDILASPSCALKQNAIKVLDHTTTAASVISGGILIGSLIPAITIAPIVLTGTAITGAGVGAYCAIRSSLKLHDRRTHKQSCSLANSEARNCFFNIAAGVSSLATAGMTKVVSTAFQKGATISRATSIAVLSTNGLNLTINGCNIVNSVYSVVTAINNKKNPSGMDIIHLSTSFLFFANAVVNFNTARTIHIENQGKSFSNVFRVNSQKLLDKAKQMFFNTDVSSFERNLNLNYATNSAEYYANILQTFIFEKQKSNCDSVVLIILQDFIFGNGFVTLNNFSSIIINKEKAFALCQIILSRFESVVQNAMIHLLKFLSENILDNCMDLLKEIFPNSEIIVILLNYIRNYLYFKTGEMEAEYQKKKAKVNNISDDEYDKNMGFSSNSKRFIHFLKIVALNMLRTGGQLDERLCKEMIKFFWDWLAEQALNYKPTQNKNKKINCKDCGGYYYKLN